MSTDILDNHDRIILSELDRDARIPYSAIAKKARLSKQAVGYRIKKLEEKGIIRGYRTLANVSMLGLIYCRLHLKLFNVDRKMERGIAESIAGMELTGWTVGCEGPYDIIVGVLGRDEMGIERTINQIIVDNREFVYEYDFAFTTRLVHFYRGYLSSKSDVPKSYLTVGSQERYTKPDPFELGSKDMEIISSLARDARASVTSIAAETGLAPETVSSRIAGFEKAGLIAHHSLLLGHGKLGMNLYKTLVFTNHMDKEVEERFLSHVAAQPNIIGYGKTLAPWDYEIDIEADDLDHYRDIIGDIRDRFRLSIRKYETLFNLKEFKFGYMNA